MNIFVLHLRYTNILHLYFNIFSLHIFFSLFLASNSKSSTIQLAVIDCSNHDWLLIDILFLQSNRLQKFSKALQNILSLLCHVRFSQSFSSFLLAKCGEIGEIGELVIHCCNHIRHLIKLLLLQGIRTYLKSLHTPLHIYFNTFSHEIFYIPFLFYLLQ